MAALDEDENYVTYGTPLEREEDLTRKKRRQALDNGQARNLPPWQQEVLDEDGRRRFHGAFTGGFSAGYYNTVGSKDGWAPKTFTSSRKKRAETAAQTAYDFMDEDEKAELDYRELGATSEFDTFGFTKAEVARRQAVQELKKRPLAIPEFLPDEIVVPVSESIGSKLLLKMGWRHGRTIGPRHIAAAPEALREGRKALLALASCEGSEGSKRKMYGAEGPPGKPDENQDDEDTEIIVPSYTPVSVISPKNDSYGLGFDPYKNAPEFREKKRSRVEKDFNEKSRNWKAVPQGKSVSHPSLFRPNIGKMGGGFGIGALEELDVEDEDVYAPGSGIEVGIIEEEEVQPPTSDNRQKSLLPNNKQGALSAFKPASVSECKVERFIPPVVPSGFVAVHKFSIPLHSESMPLSPPPPEVAPPEDPSIHKIIEGLATFVARSGKQFEDLSREKNKENPMFQFLFGGHGHDFYIRKLWEERKKIAEQGKGQIFLQTKTKATALDSEQRGRILGETPLERAPPAIASEDRARLQSALSSTFTKSSSETTEISAGAQPFNGDSAKQTRFEQFLKDRFQGGLRSMCTAQGSSLTELQRAQEALEFEAICQKAEVSNNRSSNAVGHQLPELANMMENRFTSVGIDKSLEKSRHAAALETEKYPRREEQPWRPAPVLCKRFNLLDPYAGKPPALPKPMSRMASFILVTNPAGSVPEASLVGEKKDLSIPIAQDLATHSGERKDSTSYVTDVEEQAPLETIVEKPVDLYKAIFSDDSEDDDERNETQLKQQDKSAQAAQAALNRLEAGDFLESLGKELGLMVPPSESRHTTEGKESIIPTSTTNGEMGAVIDSKGPKRLDNLKMLHVQTQTLEANRDIGKSSEGIGSSKGAEWIRSLHQIEGNSEVGSKENSITLVEKEVEKHVDKGRGSLSKCAAFSESSSPRDKDDDNRAAEARKKERKLKREKRRRGESHKEHRRKKKGRDKEQRSYKHHHHSKKHHRRRDRNTSSSPSTSSS